MAVRTSHAAGQHISNAKIAPNNPRINIPAGVGLARAMGDDEQVLDAREDVNDAFDYALGEPSFLWTCRLQAKRQDCYRRSMVPQGGRHGSNR